MISLLVTAGRTIPGLPATALRLDSLDARAERAQTVVDPLVPTVDLANVSDRGRALRAERGDEHCHTRSDVRAHHAVAVELGRSVHDRTVGIAEDDPGSEVRQLVDEEEAVLEHLLEDQHRALRLGGHGQNDRGQVGREGGPGAVLDLRDLRSDVIADDELLAARNADARAVELPAHAESLE